MLSLVKVKGIITECSGGAFCNLVEHSALLLTCIERLSVLKQILGIFE